MKHQLLPPGDQAPRLPADIRSVDSVRIWLDLMRTAESLLIAGLAREVGPEHVQDAHRKWYQEQAARHGRHMARLAARLAQAGEP